MDFTSWENEVPEAIKGDSLWRVRVYRLALFAADIGWHDVTKLKKDRRTRGLADQLYRSLGSIGANVAEGYSRASSRDQARFYEYALGSARESRDWYHKGRHVLGAAVVAHRLELLTNIIRLLLRMVPERRGKSLREPDVSYEPDRSGRPVPGLLTAEAGDAEPTDEASGDPARPFASAIAEVRRFAADNLTVRIARLQSELVGATARDVIQGDHYVSRELLLAAGAVKRASAQISVVIHAVGILHALPHLLEEDEVIKSLSLGAGSATGDFDLVTNRRCAEFKFTHWKAGANAMRKKKLFEDFYKLAREETGKMRFLYLLDATKPRRFLQGRSNPIRLLNKNQTLQEDFREQFSAQYKTVGAFYRANREHVKVVDLQENVPGFTEFMDVLEEELDDV